MHVLSINLGQERPFDATKPEKTSGIFKIPTVSPVEVTATGLVGDVIVNTKNHGGVDQAVYVYGRPDYDAFEAELGYALPNGIFGENLTIANLTSASFTIGDRLQIEDVVLEVTAPRTPCESLNARMADNQFVKRFFAADRPGFYCRVISTGFVQLGDAVQYMPYPRTGIRISEAHRIMRPGVTHDRATMERFVAEPIHSRLRTYLEAALAPQKTSE